MNRSIKEQLAPVFFPKSIALVGVSNTAVNVAYMFLQSLLDSGFPRIYPVNPKGGEMMGLKTFPSIRDIPEEVALAKLTEYRKWV